MDIDTRDDEKMSNGDAIAALMAALCGLALAAWFAYAVLAPAMSTMKVKSERELCEERGGIYGALRGDKYRCFSKEAFK
jgi:hypothetical protein